MSISPVTVITPTIDGREDFLDKAIESVLGQKSSFDRIPHLIAKDFGKVGPAKIRNTLVQEVNTPYIAFLDDDDIFYENHIETLVENASGADLVYSWCDMIGLNTSWNPNSLFDEKKLFRQNFIPVTCMVKTKTFRMLGGFSEVAREEDWDLWMRLVRSGGVVKCVPKVTWAYRKHEGNRSKF
jgi:glycosyltransferase involved in cell wall biosynthesis